ncbi:MAG: serine dehydratase beta chain, partial [Bacteroidaceae bacterium]
MKSIRELYRIGLGPSSSHTMGPRFAAEKFLVRHKDAASFKVILYGSLAATGRGHMTDVAIIDVLSIVAPVAIDWRPTVFLPFHPNGMTFIAFDALGKTLEEWTIYSVGGGALAKEGTDIDTMTPDIYEFDMVKDIMKWCTDSGRSYWEYVEACEGPEIWDYLDECWTAMNESIVRGLENESVLPGKLHLPRKASKYYIKASGYKDSLRSRGLVFAYALAVSEENAAGSRIVTAPTCGSSGVLPAVLYHLEQTRNFS